MSKAEPSPVVSFRLPTEVIEALTAHAERRGVARNVLALEAVRSYLLLLDAGLRTVPDVMR